MKELGCIKTSLQNQDKVIDEHKLALEKVVNSLSQVRQERAQDKIISLKEENAELKATVKEKKVSITEWSKFSIASLITIAGSFCGVLFWLADKWLAKP